MSFLSRALLALLLQGLFFASWGQCQTTRYVANGGSDTGNCEVEASPCETIAHALDVADSGDTIEIAAGNYGPTASAPDTGLTIDKEISLVGAGPAQTLVGRGFMHPDTRIFTIITDIDEQISIAGITIHDGVSSAGGGIFAIGEGELAISDVVFEVNFASNGGALWSDLSLTLSNVDFVDNIATGRGGAIYNATLGSLDITGGEFNANEAGIFGGAIFNNDDNILNLEGVSFFSNEADSGCGAIAMNSLQAGNGNFNNVDFLVNTAGGVGGALCLDNSAPLITDSTFAGNQSLAVNGSGYGGAIRAVNNSALEMINVDFNNNFGEDRGGAIYSAGSSKVIMENIEFVFNFTSGRGGAIYFRDESTIEITQALFEDNAAGVFGGAIFTTNDTVLDLDTVTFESNEGLWGCGAININSLQAGNGSITNVGFLNNSAGGVGGALCLDNSAPTITNTTFEGNQSLTINGNGRGGAIRAVNSSAPTLTNVQFIDNFATQRGGGLYSSASAVFLNDVLFEANKTDGEGGGMVSMGGGGAEITNAIFTDNESSDSGGGLYLNGAQDFYLRNVVFHGNEAGFAGGGMASTEAASALLVNVLFFANSAGTRGGGMANTVQSNPLIYNVTFTRNLAPDGGGMANTMFSTPELFNTLLWGNFATTGDGNEIYSTDSSWPIRNFVLHADGQDDFYVEASLIPSCIQCLHSDPLFVEPPSGNYRLQESSPAVDAGDPDTNPALFPGGAAEPVDLDGNARFWSDHIDIGAYEWQPPSDQLFSDRFEEQGSLVGHD